jgi:hypothetical protein
MSDRDRNVALNHDRPLGAFAGIWIGFGGDRGTKPQRRYLSVISVSGCETIVMNQTVLKTSNQNVFQQTQNIAKLLTQRCRGYGH